VEGDSPITIYVCLSGASVGCGESIPVGQPFSVVYVIQAGYGGVGTAYVRTSSSYTHIWEQTGLDLSWCASSGCNGWVTATGISTPGSYVAGLSLALSGGGVAAGETPFSVGTSTGAGFDFSLTLSPSSLSVTQGSTANYQIHITYSDPSFSGTTITIQDVAGLGSGMNYQVTPSPPGLHISTSQATPTGSYTITLVGSAMGVVHQASAVLLVQAAAQLFDFSITVSPLDQTLVPGASVTYNVAVNLAVGTAQGIALSVPDAPGGVTVAFSQTLGSPPFASTLTVSASPSASPGKYALTVTGIGGGKSHTAPVALIIEQSPDFRIDVNPASQTAVQGLTASYAVNVVGLNGFNSQISLTVAGLPTGVNGVFSVPSSFPDYSSTLTVTIPINSQTGSFTLTITGSGGGITRVSNVVLLVNPSQPQSQVTQSATTQTQTATPGGVVDMLQQNSLLIIAALVVLVILFAVLGMRGRGRRSVPQQMTPTRTFCGKCGAENPASNEFCASCGNKLKNS
jgi:hypothetical protein